MSKTADVVPGYIARRASIVDEATIRQLALQHAVTTHGSTVDEGEIVAAATAYLNFLAGQDAPAPTAA